MYTYSCEVKKSCYMQVKLKIYVTHAGFNITLRKIKKLKTNEWIFCTATNSKIYNQKNS